MVGLLFFMLISKLLFDELYNNLLAFIQIRLYFLTGSKEGQLKKSLSRGLGTIHNEQEILCRESPNLFV